MPNLKCGTILFHLSGRKSSTVFFLKMRVEDRAFVAMIMFVILIAKIFMFEKYLLSKQRSSKCLAITLATHPENKHNGST